MLSLILTRFIPELSDLLIKHILPSLNGKGVDKKDVKALAKRLYKKLPSSIPFVSEKTFVEFCMKHQDKIFPQKVKSDHIKKTRKPKMVASVKAVSAKKRSSTSSNKKNVRKGSSRSAKTGTKIRSNSTKKK